jgi:hypothetical protein
MTYSDLKKIDFRFQVFACFDHDYSVEIISALGGTVKASVLAWIKHLKSLLQLIKKASVPKLRKVALDTRQAQ